jgi:hypothetical protein
VHNLTHSVNLGISAARTNRRDWPVGDLAQGTFKGLLHGLHGKMGLGLPSGKGTAVIPDAKGNPATQGPGRVT